MPPKRTETSRTLSIAFRACAAGATRIAACRTIDDGFAPDRVLSGAFCAPHVGLSDRLVVDIEASDANGPEGFCATGPCGQNYFVEDR